jgi:hypothetical protein
MRNKKYCITALLFFAIINFIGAQETVTEKSTQFGFRISPNLTWTKIKTGEVNNDGMGIGFSYGIMMDKAISSANNAYLSVEAIVTSLRNKITLDDSFYQEPTGSTGAYYSDIKQDYKLQYLQIPVSLKMKTGRINGMRYTFQAGLAPGFILNRSVRVSTNPSIPGNDDWYSPNASEEDAGDFQDDPTITGERSFSNNLSRVRVPLVLGAGIEYNLSGSTSLIAGLRWDNGFTDIFRDKNVNGINNYLGLNIGVLF